MTEPLRRPHYFFGQLLTPEDFQLEQDYHRHMRQLLNRRLGSGIVDGLRVSVDPEGEVTVSPGFAFDRHGRELVVAQEWRGSTHQSGGHRRTEQVVSALWAQYPDSPAVAPTGCPPEEAFTRWLEVPVLAVGPRSQVDPDAVVLARITYAKGHPIVAEASRVPHTSHLDREPK